MTLPAGALGHPLFLSAAARPVSNEVEIGNLEQFDQFRQRGIGSGEKQTGTWMHAFSEILTAPPQVQLLRVERN